MISTKKLFFSYDKKTTFLFPDINCKMGEALLITGNSGKGKTTLLHLLGGLIKPDNGEITINNTNIAKLSNKSLDVFRGRNIGIILQQSYFVQSLSVLENVVIASWIVTGKKATIKAITLLTELGLEEYLTKLPSQLSVGQQQRVSIARALINEPKLLLADEPTSSLDDTNTAIVSELLSNVSKKHDAALIIVTHDQRLKEKFSNQINLN